MAEISKINIGAVEYDIKDATARALINSMGGGGSVSGGDADTLDGMHAVEFATAEHTHSAATTSTAGFMSKTDKASLENLKTLVGNTSISDQIASAISSKADTDHAHSEYALSNHAHSVSDISGTVPISKGGTGATDGATGLSNLFAAGNTLLSSYQYGDDLPPDSEAAPGRIFFKKA